MKNALISFLILKVNRAYSVYLPKSYDMDTNRKYPVLYLLHGMMGGNSSWFQDQHAKDMTDVLTAFGALYMSTFCK